MLRCNNNQEAWEKIFEKYKIVDRVLEQGYFLITSKQINEYREARLMTKFDNSATLPDIFKKNKFSILPITRGSYIISNFKAYEKFKTNNKDIYKIDFPEYIQSIDFNNITSESIAINSAYIAKILEDFLEEEGLVPTINGRMGSGDFKFNILKNDKDSFEISVASSQIEIDGGYESLESLTLIEAKNYISEDFMVRQLYYPYRLWKEKINKAVRTIYLVYSNGIFNIYEYEFKNLHDYNSILLVKSKRYSIENTEIDITDIQSVLNETKVINEPEISFPQADKFDRVINLCELLQDEFKTKEYITENYAFDKRQTNYYTDAARYLGLIEKCRIKKGTIIFGLTKKGQNILNTRYKNRQLLLVKSILEHKVFNECINLYFENSKAPTSNEIIEIMKKNDLYKVGSDSTYKRRASTIRGWINWILDLLN